MKEKQFIILYEEQAKASCFMKVFFSWTLL